MLFRTGQLIGMHGQHNKLIWSQCNHCSVGPLALKHTYVSFRLVTRKQMSHHTSTYMNILSLGCWFNASQMLLLMRIFNHVMSN